MAWPARVNEVQSLRAASANQPSFPAYARALTNWSPSNPISNAFFSIHAFALGARVSIPAATNACSSRISRRDPFEIINRKQHGDAQGRRISLGRFLEMVHLAIGPRYPHAQRGKFQNFLSYASDLRYRRVQPCLSDSPRLT